MPKNIRAPKAKILVGLVAVGALFWGWQQQQTPARNSGAKVSSPVAPSPSTSASTQATPSGQGR
jgi:hypothetical protein